MSASQTHFTPEDVLRLEEEGLYELVHGKLVEKQIGPLVSMTVGLVAARLGVYLQRCDAGVALIEQTYQCFPHEPAMVRRPDVSFIAASRVASVPEDGHIPIAPDLAVEVVSLDHKIDELSEKLADYRLAAVNSVWVVNPKQRTVRVHRLDHAHAELNESATLIDESVLPGFSVLVKDLLPPPAKARAPVQP